MLTLEREWVGGAPVQIVQQVDILPLQMLPYCADLMRSLREYYKNEYDTVGAVTLQVSACESVLIKTSTIVIANRDVAEFAEKGFQLLPANHEEFKMKVRPEFALDKPAVFAHVRTCKHRCLSLECCANLTNVLLCLYSCAVG